MARRLGDEGDEYGLDEDEEERGLIELGSTGGRGRRSGSRPIGGAAASDSGGSTTCRWATLLFLLALAGVYHMGLTEGKNEVKNEGGGGMEDVEKRVPWHQKVFAPKDGGSGGGGSPASAPANFGTFTLQHLRDTRQKAREVIETLDKYYFSKDQATNMLMKPWLVPWDFSHVIVPNSTVKPSREAKLVDTMARALVTDDQTTFLMGGIGSSVMAGHDNCHYDSYQTQMERFWGPVWKAAGMEFVFQNGGEGGGCGDSFANQKFCVKQNISPDVDIVHYSWTYFEGDGAHPTHEDLIRWTQMMPKQPPVHILNTGVVHAANHPYNQLAQYYPQYGFNAFYMRTGFNLGGHDYATEEANNIKRFGWGYIGDGYHNTTRYGEIEADVARKQSLGVVMRNWHPGPMGFQLASDSYTYVYTHALLKALDLIEGDMNTGKDPRDKWAASERPLLLKSDLPPPKFCDAEYCTVDEAPGCLNYELPVFGNWGPRVEDPDDDLNPYKGEVQNWNIWHQDNDLWYMVGKQDTAVFKSRDDKEICRHLDACGGISAQKAEDGMVVFRLPKMEVGLVVICGCCGKKVGDEFFKSNPNIEISYNTVPIAPSAMDVWPNEKCVRVMKRFPTSGRQSETPTGHHYMGVKMVNDHGKPIRISHVITL